MLYKSKLIHVNFNKECAYFPFLYIFFLNKTKIKLYVLFNFQIKKQKLLMLYLDHILNQQIKRVSIVKFLFDDVNKTI